MNQINWLDSVDKRELIHALGELMSLVSEECYYAGWMNGTEYFIPELCHRALKTQKAQAWGHGELRLGMAAVIQTISDKLGHWVKLDDQGIGYVAFDPFPIPKECIDKLKQE